MNGSRFLLYPLLAAALLVSACGGQPTAEAEPPKQIYSYIEIDDFPVGDRIFFDFDSAEVRPDAIDQIGRVVAWYTDRPDHELVLEGHTDWRGPEDYNLALGCRRAKAARQAMIELGFPAVRLELVSYGEYRPAVQGESHDAWAQNRRVTFGMKDNAQGYGGPNCGER